MDRDYAARRMPAVRSRCDIALERIPVLSGTGPPCDAREVQRFGAPRFRHTKTETVIVLLIKSILWVASGPFPEGHGRDVGPLRDPLQNADT